MFFFFLSSSSPPSSSSLPSSGLLPESDGRCWEAWKEARFKGAVSTHPSPACSRDSEAADCDYMGTGPNKSAAGLQTLGHHVVNESVLVPDLQLVKLGLVRPAGGHDVFETAVIGLEDGVLGAQVQRPSLLDGVLEAAVSKATDRLCDEDIEIITDQQSNTKYRDEIGRISDPAMCSHLIGVVHSHSTASSLEVIDLPLPGVTSVRWSVIVAHLTATLYFFVARAESMVTWSSVRSRYGRPRSKYFSSTSTFGRMS
ncbi:hypothetical protein CCH79_00004828 [Gambusia affinis]|uniref:Uncharacterized protein n=1 Tax=Gambusia affinis TaxID=33528 RepID=A0A315V804_GAMAF|nr:hypothetical protein CCH79_00004828 [Gambusia affinis]